MRLYDNASSGNAYKVRWLAHALGLELPAVEMDIDTGQTRTDAFLTINPNGRVPVLELDDGRHLAESNAILHYLAEGTQLWPADRFSRSRVLQWMFFEQYSHEPFIAVSRFILTHLPAGHARRSELPALKPKGEAALAVMEAHLADVDFLVGSSLSIADIALFAYTHVAHEGGFDLARYPAIREWIARCQAQQGFLAMDA